MNDRRPATYNDWRSHFADPLMSHQPAGIYEAGVDEGIRWERQRQLAETTDVVIAGLEWPATVEKSVEVAFSLVREVLAELERRNDGKA